MTGATKKDVYSLAWRIARDGYTMMHPLPMDFRGDPNTRDMSNQYIRHHSIILFPDFYRFQISGGTDYLTGAAAITFCRINTWKGFIGFFVPLDLNCLIGAGP